MEIYFLGLRLLTNTYRGNRNVAYREEQEGREKGEDREFEFDEIS